MKRFLFIYLPIICIAVAALLKLNSGAIDHEVKSESEPSAQIDSSLTDIPLKTIPTKEEEEELKELKEQIQQLNEKVSDLEKENDQLTRISNSEEEKSKTTTRKTDVNTENQIVNEEVRTSPLEKTRAGESMQSDSDEIFNFAVVEKKPIYPGCENETTEDDKFMCFNTSIMKHIGREFDFPELARQLGIQGKVYVNFVIEKNGRISSVTIARGVDKLIDDEAIRVIRKLPKLGPAMINGKAVRMQYTVPINARLK